MKNFFFMILILLFSHQAFSVGPCPPGSDAQGDCQTPGMYSKFLGNAPVPVSSYAAACAPDDVCGVMMQVTGCPVFVACVARSGGCAAIGQTKYNDSSCGPTTCCFGAVQGSCWPDNGSDPCTGGCNCVSKTSPPTATPTPTSAPVPTSGPVTKMGGACTGLEAQGYTVFRGTLPRTLGPSAQCLANEVKLERLNMGSTQKVCIKTDCGKHAVVCRESAAAGNRVDYFCATK